MKLFLRRTLVLKERKSAIGNRKFYSGLLAIYVSRLALHNIAQNVQVSDTSGDEQRTKASSQKSS